MHRFLLAGLLLAAGASAQTNPVHDDELSWRTYAAERSARVRVFLCEDERRPRTVVIDERAGNGGVVTDEAQYLADLVGRELGFDPTAATFVFRFTPASFVADASERGKTLLLRATFGRTGTGALASPTWRVIGGDDLAELTDRALR
jgi:hypothetical protein